MGVYIYIFFFKHIYLAAILGAVHVVYQEHVSEAHQAHMWEQLFFHMVMCLQLPLSHHSVLQINSVAAHELDKIRKLASEEDRSSSSPSSSENSACTSPIFPHPPPPPAPTIAPPLPSPVLPQGKTNSVPHSAAHAPVNPALAREAMLEAIRSGSAAERLKKVWLQKNIEIYKGALY